MRSHISSSVAGAPSRRRRVLELVEVEAAVAGAAAAGDRAGAQHAQEGEIVLDCRDADLAGVADHLADGVDFAVALGAFAEDDVGVLRPRDEGAAHGQRDHVEADAGLLDALAQLRQAVHGPRLVELAQRQGAANVLHAEGGENLQVGVGGVALMADFHAALRRRIGLRRLVGASGEGGGAGRGDGQEFSAVHVGLPHKGRKSLALLTPGSRGFAGTSARFSNAASGG